ncbi:MAG: GNAT family N-acetyltransferase [Methanobacterium paludis]|uniref:GCN5-related N-acetyltransferase n=1 Tax=Methanobacterium paludis (strain DSM 25820 / JCM 18151 / SWAN1) TaxID=868131 RepID=F6D492_METPW|nr:GNAT family N-acetyltransferase [Methanobacterium paludis]AEG18091.1 GCN5-related N-acetyltransferase [Methanobacterium paludis]MCE7698344.1 GNAT family N-acetyltransferase [Methanobacterium paludis]
MIEKVRLIKYDELKKLLSLYEYLVPDDPKLKIDKALKGHWDEILSDPNHFYLVIEEDEMLVSSCNLTIIKNLTRSARSYGLIENVVTHPDYRKRGYGTAVLKKAVGIAQKNNCYKVMLMTSQKDESTLRFYEKAGFNMGEKTAFIVRI